MSTPSTVPPSPAKEKKSSATKDSGEKLQKRSAETLEEDLQAEAPRNQQLFKRVFSEGDEIKLLNAFLDICKTANASPSPAHAAVQIFNNVGDSFRGQFTNKQLTDKLSKLRRKYAKQINNDKTPKTTHDLEVFLLSQKIWGNGEEESAAAQPIDPCASPAEDLLIQKGGVKKKRKVKTGSQFSTLENRQKETRVHLASLTDEHGDAKAATHASPAENGGETITVAVAGLALENFPYLMQEVSRLPWDAVLMEGLRSLDGSVLKRLNEEWRSQNIAEVKVMRNRAQLVQEHSKLMLDAIDSSLPDQENLGSSP